VTVGTIRNPRLVGNRWSNAQLQRILSVGYTTIARWRTLGLPEPHTSDTEDTYRARINVWRSTVGRNHAAVDQQALAAMQALPTARPKYASHESSQELNRQRAARADLLELELAQLRGETVRRDDVLAAWEERIAAVRSRLLGLEAQLTALLAPHVTDMEPKALARLIKGAVHEALHEFARADGGEAGGAIEAGAGVAPVAVPPTSDRHPTDSGPTPEGGT